MMSFTNTWPASSSTALTPINVNLPRPVLPPLKTTSMKIVDSNERIYSDLSVDDGQTDHDHQGESNNNVDYSIEEDVGDFNQDANVVDHELVDHENASTNPSTVARKSNRSNRKRPQRFRSPDADASAKIRKISDH